MQKSFIKINSRDITVSDLRAMLSSQHQLSALTEMAEHARLNKTEFIDGKTFSEKFLAEVKKIIS